MIFNTLFIIDHNISRFHYFFGPEIVHLVCFAWCRISKKDPFITFCIKLFKILMISKDVALTTKYSEVFYDYFFSFPKFIWSLLSIRLKIHLVQCMTCSVYSFFPEWLCHTFVIQHDSGHFLDHSVLSFHNSIPLRCLGFENSCSVPWSLQKDASLEFSNSLPWSLLC